MPARYENINTVYSKVQDTKGEDGLLTVSKAHVELSKFPEFLPTWNLKEFYPPLEFFKHIDAGSRADPSFPNLLPAGQVTKKHITPKLGTEVTGVQLSQLDDAGKDELALFVAQRGVVVFRQQDFSSHGAKFSTDYGRYFGPLHIHPTSGAPKGHPEVHVVYRRADNDDIDIFKKRNNLVQFHSDVSYELQPPATTFFTVLEGPESGGDTLFADTEEAYNRLSDAFKARLDGLHVLHTSTDQAKFLRKQGGAEKRDPVNNIHPLVRVHPVTGNKSLYVNPGFARKIVELKEEESEYLLTFLFDHIAKSHDLQARAKWEPNTVVVWDNRRVLHTAILDWDNTTTRHAYRITPQGERPIADLKDLNKADVNQHVPKESI